MTHEWSWEDLANELRQIKHVGEPLRADWLAHKGSENHGIWLLRPDGLDTYEAREAFCLVAARAIEKLGIAPIPAPTPLQHDPNVREQIALLGGDPVDQTEIIVPFGLNEIAVDPCTRAWLEVLRRERKAFRSSWSATLQLEGHEYKSFEGTIPDVCRASAIYCTQSAKDEIRKRIEKRAEGPTGKPAHKLSEPQPDRGETTKQIRAQTVAKLIKELNDLRPQMFEDESEYDRLRTHYSDFLVFKIAEQRTDLRMKIRSIQGSVRHIRLAQELAAAHHGRKLSTIQDDWKDHKPLEFRR